MLASLRFLSRLPSGASTHPACPRSRRGEERHERRLRGFRGFRGGFGRRRANGYGTGAQRLSAINRREGELHAHRSPAKPALLLRERGAKSTFWRAVTGITCNRSRSHPCFVDTRYGGCPGAGMLTPVNRGGRPCVFWGPWGYLPWDWGFADGGLRRYDDNVSVAAGNADNRRADAARVVGRRGRQRHHQLPRR